MQADANPPEGPGNEVKDFLPIPATDPTDPANTHSDGQASSKAPGEGPTFSHALAAESGEKDGVAQKEHAQEVLDLGWNEKKEDIPAPLVGGLENEELWMLIRRFNKQIYDVKATPYPPPGGLDLYVADDEEFSPDKLRSNVERLYMTVGVGVLAAVKHVARLRSWKETRRTAYFAAAYFAAWLFDVLGLLLSAFVVALVGFPRTRDILFPPAPVSLVDTKTGGVQKPAAGVLGSHDSATGAPEHRKGEAVEQEASNFVSGIASVALSSAAGKDPQGDPEWDDNAATDAIPDPTALAMSSADAKGKASEARIEKRDKTKVPMENVIWAKMRPVMHMISTIADTWERFANALCPIPLFPSEVFRMRLVAILLPLLFGPSLFVTPYMLVKSLTLFLGLIFFGDPVIARGLAWLNRNIPNWQKLLEPRNTILKGVPTNAQLTLTLLRQSEARRAPLPPPPRTAASPPPDQPAPLSASNLRATGTSSPPLGATQADLRDAALTHGPTPAQEPPASNPDLPAAREAHHGRKGSRLLGALKSATRGAVRTAVGTDSVRARAGGPGSGHARDRLGVIPAGPGRAGAGGDGYESGPVEFEGRFEGARGRVILTASGATVPVLAFVKGGKGDGGTVEIAGEARADLRPVWSVAVADVAEMKKIGGYGWKAKLVVGWSMEREVKDGLVLRTRSGQEYKITALPLRDELFNRLVAMGGQKWVAY